jgi:hypothetical protein
MSRNRQTPPEDAGRRDTRALEWWLDTSAMPDRLLWARLLVGIDGVQVFDLDGRMHLFDRLDDAVAWLRADEYEALEILRAEGDVEADIGPPRDDAWRQPPD